MICPYLEKHQNGKKEVLFCIVAKYCPSAIITDTLCSTASFSACSAYAIGNIEIQFGKVKN